MNVFWGGSEPDAAFQLDWAHIWSGSQSLYLCFFVSSEPYAVFDALLFALLLKL